MADLSAGGIPVEFAFATFLLFVGLGFWFNRRIVKHLQSIVPKTIHG